MCRVQGDGSGPPRDGAALDSTVSRPRGRGVGNGAAQVSSRTCEPIGDVPRFSGRRAVAYDDFASSQAPSCSSRLTAVAPLQSARPRVAPYRADALAAGSPRVAACSANPPTIWRIASSAGSKPPKAVFSRNRRETRPGLRCGFGFADGAAPENLRPCHRALHSFPGPWESCGRVRFAPRRVRCGSALRAFSTPSSPSFR